MECSVVLGVNAMTKDRLPRAQDPHTSERMPCSFPNTRQAQHAEGELTPAVFSPQHVRGLHKIR
eukprot:2131273-Rhodomonas_salina.2